MNTRISIQVTLDQALPGLQVASGHFIEASLDCFSCKKRLRTIAMATSEANIEPMRKSVLSYARNIPEKVEQTICLPTGHTFPARVGDFSTSNLDDSIVISCEFEFDYQPFVSKARWRGGASSEQCSWVRVSFRTVCPQCDNSAGNSVQTNLVRPHKRKCKNCKSLLYIDSKAPMISTVSIT